MAPAHPLLLYLHGFLSSPDSFKARQTGAFITQHRLPIDYHVPALGDRPAVARECLLALLAAQPSDRQIALIGSSLGGFHATWLAERFGLRAVLVNPAVQPSRWVLEHQGAYRNPYTATEFSLAPNDAHCLAELQWTSLQRPDHLWLLAQQGDEVIDYRSMVQAYSACPQTVEPGGEHAFVGYERYLPDILRFLQLPGTAALPCSTSVLPLDSGAYPVGGSTH